MKTARKLGYSGVMAVDLQTAYTRLVNALEEFHSSVLEFSDAEAPAVLRATDHLVDAYTVYDDAIFTQYGVEMPFDTYSDDDDDDDYEGNEAFDFYAHDDDDDDDDEYDFSDADDEDDDDDYGEDDDYDDYDYADDDDEDDD